MEDSGRWQWWKNYCVFFSIVDTGVANVRNLDAASDTFLTIDNATCFNILFTSYIHLNDMLVLRLIANNVSFPKMCQGLR